MGIYRELEEKGYFSLSSYTQARYGGAYNIMYRAIDSYNPATGRFGLENSELLVLLSCANTNMLIPIGLKTLFRPSLTQNHTVSLSGGGENATVYASVGFFVDPGWTIADRVHRVTGNLKTTYNLSQNVKIGVLTQGSIRTQRAPGTFNRSANTVNGGYDRDFDINLSAIEEALSTSSSLCGNY